MKLKTSLRAFAVLSLGGWLMAGCGSSSGNNGNGNNAPREQAPRNIAIAFDAMMGHEALVCSENGAPKIYGGVGTTAESVSVTDFRFFVSEVSMVKADGTRVLLTLENNSNQYQAQNGDNVALLDFEDNTGNCVDRGNTPQTYGTIVGTVAEGEYTGIEFTLGVPFAINHDKESYVDVEVLNQPKMEWNWQAGRKFTKMEVRSESNPSLVWNFHLGSTGCVASEDNSTVVTESCAQPNRVTVLLENFDPEQNAVKVNFKKLLMQNNVGDDLGGAKGCMSGLTDPECQTLMPQLALDVANQNGLCVNGNDCGSQQLFYTISK